MKEKITSLIIILILAPLLVATSALAEEAEKPKNFMEKVSAEVKKQLGGLKHEAQDAIAKTKIEEDLELVNGEVFEGITAALKYKISSEPSHKSGYYNRMDRYTFNVNLNPGDLLMSAGESLPIGLSISENTELFFIRQFPCNEGDNLIACRGKALLKPPYFVKNIPLTAEKAIKNLNVGDFVGFEANLRFVASGGQIITTFLTGGYISASAHYSVEGRFMVHIFKVDQNHVRVKLIASRGKSAGFGVASDIPLDHLKISQISIIDKQIINQIKRRVELKPIELGISKSKNDVFLVDYVFNLANPEAREAYDNVMDAKMAWNSAKLANPIAGAASLGARLYSDLNEVEEIFIQDKDKSPENRRVERVFKGVTSVKSVNSRIKFGLNLINFESGSANAENKIVVYDHNDKPTYYLLNSYTRTDKLKAIFGLYGHDQTLSAQLLFLAEPVGQVGSSYDANHLKLVPKKFVALNLNREKKYKELEQDDFAQIQSHVDGILPDFVYSLIDWNKRGWDMPRGELVNANLNSNLFFHDESMQFMEKQNPVELMKKLEALVEHMYFKEKKLRGIQGVGVDEKGHRTDCANPQSPRHFNGFGCLAIDARKIGYILGSISNHEMAPEVRHKMFVALKDIPLFQVIGGRTLMALIPEEKLTESISYRLSLGAKDADPIQFQFGKPKLEEVYEAIQYIKQVLYNRSYDLSAYQNQIPN